MVAIDLPPWTILSYILLGSILGMIGQGIRVVVGLKKAQAEAEATKKNLSWDQWFDTKQLMTSLALAVLVGAVAGALGILPYMAENGTLNEKDIITLIVAGYAGTDFIEGFISSQNLPK